MTPKNKQGSREVKERKEKVKMTEEETNKVKGIIQELKEQEEQIQKCSDAYDEKIEKLKKEKREALERTRDNFKSPEKLSKDYSPILMVFLGSLKPIFQRVPRINIYLLKKEDSCTDNHLISHSIKEVSDKLKLLSNRTIINYDGNYFLRDEFLNKLSKLNESQLD